MLDVTHHGRKPITRFLRPYGDEVFLEGMPVMLKRYGLPLERFLVGYVHGCQYMRPLGIGEPEKSNGGSPPKPLLWLVSRLHPEMRRRNRTAKRAWAERRWRKDVDTWFEGGKRDEAVAANRALQAVNACSLDDAALLAHLDDTVANFRKLGRMGFVLHGGDIVPTGDYFAHCLDWGIPMDEAASLLAGASPASLETARLLAPVARAIAEAPSQPRSIEEVRALSPEADAAVSEWINDHGWRLLFSDDIDSPTLAESPGLALRALLGAVERAEPVPDPAPIRQRVPAEHRAAFDERLAEARYGLRLRDDSVGIQWNWPAGLVRRALLEIGRRLVERRQLVAAEHVLGLEHGQVGPMLLEARGPSSAELAEAWAFRDAVVAAEPPLALGPESAPPPFDVLPAHMARAGRAVMTLVSAMEGEPPAAPSATGTLAGTGIGSASYTGRARIVTDPVEALSTLEEGDVVVAAITGPSWNSLLPMIGALVVEAGGPLSHAAIVAREYGIPAMVGVAGATSSIPEGARVEVVPAEGLVRVL